NQLIGCAEFAASELLSKTDYADRNAAFIQWMASNGRWELAGRVTIRVLPDNKDVRLAEIEQHSGTRTAQYYTGSDQHIMNTFSGEGSCLFQIAQSQSRERAQLHYLKKLGIKEVPDAVH